MSTPTGGLRSERPRGDASADQRSCASASLIEGLLSPISRTVALHDWVRDEIPFGWGPRFYDETPEQTMARRIGYSITKSAVLVHRLRAEGITARMVVVELDPAVLDGLVAPAGEWVDHAVVEVCIGGDWIGFDSHVVDLPLLRGATRRLTLEGRTAGYGTVASATGLFPSWSQFAPGQRGRVIGQADSLDMLAASGAELHNRLPWLLRRVFGLIGRGANSRAVALRTGTA